MEVLLLLHQLKIQKILIYGLAMAMQNIHPPSEHPFLKLR